MARRRGGRSQKAAPSSNSFFGEYLAKAMPTDSGMLSNTIADMNARTIGNNEIYWSLYKGHPWIRACIDIIANAVSQEGFDLRPTDESQSGIDESDPRIGDLQQFFRICWVGRFNTFRKAIKALVTDQQTYGAAYLRRKHGQVNGSKALAGLERLDARYVTPHLAEDKKSIDYFVLAPPKMDVSGPIQQAAQQMSSVNGMQDSEKIPAGEIIMFSTDYGGDAVLPSPSPLEALDLTAAMDMNVRKHRNSFFENGATLGNVLCCENASDDQVRDAQKKLTLHHVSSRRAYRNLAIAGKWSLLNLMQGGKHEVDFVKGTGIVIEEVMAVYKIPPGKLRDVAGALGQAGKNEDDETFEQECVLPIEECIYETLTLEIIKKEFEIDDLEMIPARRNKLHLERIEAAVSLLKCGGTGNEARDLIGLPRSDAPGMDVPMFLAATQGNVAGDEPADPSQPAPPQEGEVTDPEDVDDETGNDGERGRKARANPKARRKVWY